LLYNSGACRDIIKSKNLDQKGLQGIFLRDSQSVTLAVNSRKVFKSLIVVKGIKLRIEKEKIVLRIEMLNKSFSCKRRVWKSKKLRTLNSKNRINI